MKTFYLTDSGKVRNHNEDSVTIVRNANNEYLLAVADGMGGHKSGEVASSIAISHLGKRFSEMSKVGSKQDAANWLKDNINEINSQIFKYVKGHEKSEGMGTTLVTCIFTDEYLIFGNIGDSSGYVLKDKSLHKVTQDHTLVKLLVATGELSEEEAESHPRKNVLMRALGANDPAEIDIFDVDIDVDAILLCSDGLTSMLTNDQIEKVLNSDLSIEEKIAKLVRKSNNRGGTDNISIAYLEKEEGEEA